MARILLSLLLFPAVLCVASTNGSGNNPSTPLPNQQQQLTLSQDQLDQKTTDTAVDNNSNKNMMHNNNNGNNFLIQQHLSSIFAESALVDKETGRIFWEGGLSSKTSSMSTTTAWQGLQPLLSKVGILHIKSIVLSSVLLLALVGSLSTLLRELIQQNYPSIIHATHPRLLVVFEPLLWILQRIVLGAPKFNQNFALFVYALYMIESWNCQTRSYLRHVLHTPEQVEQHVELLRKAEPVVEWSVRTFHYDYPEWIKRIQRIYLSVSGKKHALLEGRNFGSLRSKSQLTVDENSGLDSSVIDSITKNVGDSSNDTATDGPKDIENRNSNRKTLFSLPDTSIWKKKVVTHQAQGQYQLGKLLLSNDTSRDKDEEVQDHRVKIFDQTSVGVWRRAASTSVIAAKIKLSQLLVLGNAATRQDYLKQQADFCRKYALGVDDYAEFSTRIDLPGYKSPVLLAIREPGNNKEAFTARLVRRLMRPFYFWVFTMLGLTLPFRLWITHHCDEIRVAVVKEARLKNDKKKKSYSASSSPKFTSWLWGSWSGSDKTSKKDKSVSPIDDQSYRIAMQQLQLYRSSDEKKEKVVASLPLKLPVINSTAIAPPINVKQESKVVVDSTDDANTTKEVAVTDLPPIPLRKVTSTGAKHNETKVKADDLLPSNATAVAVSVLNTSTTHNTTASDTNQTIKVKSDTNSTKLSESRDQNIDAKVKLDSTKQPNSTTSTKEGN